MSDQDIIDRAVARHLSGETITDGQARVIASGWHGGQVTALCALATSGAILSECQDEIDAELRVHNERPSASRELMALADYVRTNGTRTAQRGWHAIWG